MNNDQFGALIKVKISTIFLIKIMKTMKKYMDFRRKINYTFIM